MTSLENGASEAAHPARPRWITRGVLGIVFAHPGIGAVDLPVQRQNERHRMLCYGKGRVFRHARDGEAEARRRGEDHVVKPG